MPGDPFGPHSEWPEHPWIKGRSSPGLPVQLPASEGKSWGCSTLLYLPCHDGSKCCILSKQNLDNQVWEKYSQIDVLPIHLLPTASLLIIKAASRACTNHQLTHHHETLQALGPPVSSISVFPESLQTSRRDTTESVQRCPFPSLSKTECPNSRLWGQIPF